MTYLAVYLIFISGFALGFILCGILTSNKDEQWPD